MKRLSRTDLVGGGAGGVGAGGGLELGGGVAGGVSAVPPGGVGVAAGGLAGGGAAEGAASGADGGIGGVAGGEAWVVAGEDGVGAGFALGPGALGVGVFWANAWRPGPATNPAMRQPAARPARRVVLRMMRM